MLVQKKFNTAQMMQLDHKEIVEDAALTSRGCVTTFCVMVLGLAGRGIDTEAETNSMLRFVAHWRTRIGESVTSSKRRAATSLGTKHGVSGTIIPGHTGRVLH